MRYRFLVTNREGASGSFECNLVNDASAQNMAFSIFINVSFIQVVTVYRLLSDDNCGPVAFIATVNYNNL